MRKSGRIVRYTQDEIEERIARGEDRTDWARVDALSEAELEAAIADDPDAEVGPLDLTRMNLGIPKATHEVHLEVDAGVLDWFKARDATTVPASTPCCAPMSSTSGNVRDGMTARTGCSMTIDFYAGEAQATELRGFAPCFRTCRSASRTAAVTPLHEAAVTSAAGAAGHHRALLEGMREDPRRRVADDLPRAIETTSCDAGATSRRCWLEQACSDLRKKARTPMPQAASRALPGAAPIPSTNCSATSGPGCQSRLLIIRTDPPPRASAADGGRPP